MIAWKLRTTMRVEDAINARGMALPRLAVTNSIFANGPDCYDDAQR
jgi:hypothetical protein